MRQTPDRPTKRPSNPNSISGWMLGPIRPLARRIPVLMVAMLATSLATMGWLGYDRINRFAEEAETTRLQASTNELLVNLQGTLARVRADISRFTASRPLGVAVSPFATAADRAAARRLLGAHRETSPQFVSVAIWNDAGQLIEADGAPDMAERQRPSKLESGSDANTVVVGPMTMRGDTAYYSITAPILGADSTALGYVVATRRLISTTESAAMYRALVGPHARVMFGNVGDMRSMDLARGHPTIDVLPDTGATEYKSGDNVTRFYSRGNVPDTPWRVVIDEPRHLALESARRFAFGMLVVAAIFIIIATTVVWIVTGRSLRPLAKVTQAVVGFAQGEHAQKVPVQGDDEIAQFGHAFNAMVDKVASRTDALVESIHEHQESEQRYRALIDTLPDGIMVHHNREIAFVNPACARLFGETDAQALIGRSILDFVDPMEHEMTMHRLDQVAVGDRVPMRELRLRRVDGKRVVVESTNMPLTIDGESAIQTILHDVTDRHALEDRLRQSQKLEAVGRLAGGIAHDFNNLLTVIDAHAEFALRTDEGEAARAADIEEIRRASASAARLTRQLLTFSRKQTAAPTNLDLSDSIKDVLVMLNRLLGDDVEVEADLASDLWPVFADPSHIEQVLLNLALNARDAMPQGGRLSFSTANAEVGPDYRSSTGEMIPEGEYVVLIVEDTGIGMSQEVASKVFEPFFTTKAGRGTGLGLSTVYGIVKQAEGHIWLYTEPGRGTVFKIMFPKYRTTEEMRKPARVSEQRMLAVAGHVLVVEDQPNVRAAISRFLRNAGFAVTDVRDAEAALRVMEDGADVDMVVTDMVMPGKTGAELATELSVTHPGLPVIIMSGYSEEMTNRQWKMPENSVFVEKPVSPKTLIKAIHDRLVTEKASVS